MIRRPDFMFKIIFSAFLDQIHELIHTFDHGINGRWQYGISNGADAQGHRRFVLLYIETKS